MKQKWNSISRFTQEVESPGLLFWQTYSIWRRMIEQALQEFGLTHVQFVLLASLGYLEHKKILVSQNDLATFTQCDVSMASQVIRTLEKKGLLKRIQKEGDERSKFPHITPKGEALLKKAIQVVENIDKNFFGTLGTKQKDFIHCLIELQKSNN